MARFLHWLDARAEAGETPSEIEIAERLEAFRRDTGALLDIAFDTISASAKQSRKSLIQTSSKPPGSGLGGSRRLASWNAQRAP